MKKETKLTLQITFFSVILIINSIFLVSFLFSDFYSIFDFIDFLYKHFIWKPERFMIFLVNLLVVLIWIFYITLFSFKKYFLIFEKNNKSLKDYNHYLAHELKTPISVVFSDLEVLKYWFDVEIVKNSQEQLKNMISIIDILLSFSEDLNLSEKNFINLENFLKSCINSDFLTQKENIFIENNEFNFFIETNEILFKRVIFNILWNALKYTKDWRVFVKIEDKKIFFINQIENDFSDEELHNLLSKFYRKDNLKIDWHWLWLSLINESLRFLWYKFKIYSKEKKFFAEISFEPQKK